MSSIVVFGGSGYAGGHIVEAAAVRGLDVKCVTRKESATQIAGVTYSLGSLLDSDDRSKALAGAEVLIIAVSPRGDMAGRTRAAIADMATDAERAGVRLGVVGGAGSLLVSEGGPRLLELDEFAEEFRPEAEEMSGVLDDLRAREGTLDWFLVSPAAEFGAHSAGEYLGEYRVGGDVLLTDDQGRSAISGADFGVAVVDEIESPVHHRARFTVAY
ncbi:NAD(P)-dependent oxidoreductase [Leucobacter denitrificans]|uniref:NAD(P)H-binding protein n=1 Tax=Leucobacter denitrificans TaxID=683042 RepID=A0A7G9S5X0_9MICO|nr:NAD(P)H-binding protein [Leucobacter denitrificans]QNN63245.1 NAD(P)H-binding protein [Leucobacter denitrificans]